MLGIDAAGNRNPPTSVAIFLTGASTLTYQVYAPERLKSCELGSKKMSLYKGLTVKASVVSYNYANFQLPILVQVATFPATGPSFLTSFVTIVEAPKVVNWGGELESTFLLTEDDRLGLSIANLNSQVKASTVIGGYDMKGGAYPTRPNEPSMPISRIRFMCWMMI